MKFSLAHAVLSLALWLPGAAALAAPRPGCGDTPDPAETYVFRAQQAQSRGDHATTADALWNAWCKTGDLRHLVGICEEQVQLRDLGRAAETVRYTEHRLAGGGAADIRQALESCKQKLPQAPAAAAAGAGQQAKAVNTGAAPAPPAAPAQAGAARPGCKDASDPAETYLSRVQQAQSRGDHAGAADALWGAWCKTGELRQLVGICEEQFQARQPAQAAEIVRYAERRLAIGGGSAAEQANVRQALQDCKQRVSAAAPAAGPDAGQMAKAAPPSAPPLPQATKVARLPAPPLQLASAGATQVANLVSVIIQSTPPDASVYVDGRLYGIRGTPVCLGLTPGAHDLRLERPGHHPASKQIMVDREARLDFTLQRQ